MINNLTALRKEQILEDRYIAELSKRKQINKLHFIIMLFNALFVLLIILRMLSINPTFQVLLENALVVGLGIAAIAALVTI